MHQGENTQLGARGAPHWAQFFVITCSTLVIVTTSLLRRINDSFRLILCPAFSNAAVTTEPRLPPFFVAIVPVAQIAVTQFCVLRDARQSTVNSQYSFGRGDAW